MRGKRSEGETHGETEQDKDRGGETEAEMGLQRCRGETGGDMRQPWGERGTQQGREKKAVLRDSAMERARATLAGKETCPGRGRGRGCNQDDMVKITTGRN